MRFSSLEMTACGPARAFREFQRRKCRDKNFSGQVLKTRGPEGPPRIKASSWRTIHPNGSKMHGEHREGATVHVAVRRGHSKQFEKKFVAR